jgi:Holliday junction resolvase RusA-like endonuclease
VKIELDFPPSELFPNRAKGTHWTKLHHVRGNYRQTSAWLAKHQLKTWTHDGGDVHLKLTFVMPDKRFRDLDNCLAASKAALDGLSDALMVNDKFFHPITVSREVGTRKTAKLIIEIGE